MVIQSDMNLPQGESLLRQALLGKRYFQEKFNLDVRVAFCHVTSAVNRLVFPVNLPPLGYRLYRFAPGLPRSQPSTSLRATPDTLANEFWFTVSSIKLCDQGPLQVSLLIEREYQGNTWLPACHLALGAAGRAVVF